MPDNLVDLIAIDPPYFKVKKESWDNQWDTVEEYLDWIGKLCEQWERILKPNGSFYCFASSRMAARVECEIAKRFNILNNIIWIKPNGPENHAEKKKMRNYFPQTERIIFAEHYGSDNIAKGETSYQSKCDDLRGFIFEPLRKYLADEWKRAELKNDQANEACGTASMAGRHFFSNSQWCLPTREHYYKLREYANKNNNGGECFRREYEYLRREYEDLRREYEDLRRPFKVMKDINYTDVWTLKAVQYYPGKHPCEKPVEIMKHIIRISSNLDAVILDCFMGRGTTGVAALELGRKFIGIEINKNWYESAKKRIMNIQLDLLMVNR